MSSDEIDITHVAKLARLALEPAEIETFRAQLGALLEHVNALAGLSIADVAATAQVIVQSNVMRDDVAQPSLDRELLLATAPEREGPFFRVPRILAQEE